MHPQAYRYESENAILLVTLLVLGAATLFTAGLTVCMLPLLALVLIVVSYSINRSYHRMGFGQPVTPESTPALARLADDCVHRLAPGEVRIFVAPSRQRNAYAFGLSSPRIVVLNSSLFEVMDEDEIRFILGHELGHVALGHTTFNSLLGGMAGVPLSVGVAVVLIFAFRWWNRACEYSADRAGLLACGNPNKAISALVKLVGGAGSPAEYQRTLRAIEQQDDSLLNVLAETLNTHPMTVRRIAELRRYAASPAYAQHQAAIGRPLRPVK